MFKLSFVINTHVVSYVDVVSLVCFNCFVCCCGSIVHVLCSRIFLFANVGVCGLLLVFKRCVFVSLHVHVDLSCSMNFAQFGSLKVTLALTLEFGA